MADPYLRISIPLGRTFDRTILHWIASLFFFFLLPFLCITVPIGCLSLAEDGDGRQYDSPLDRKFFFFFFSFLFLYHSIAFFFFFFGLERENVKQSDEKKSVGYFNCNVFILFYFKGVFF